MKFLVEKESELFITTMRWLVILGSPLLFYLSKLPMGVLFWTMIGITTAVNLYTHIFLLSKPVSKNYAHFLSVLDTIFVSILLFFGGENQTDLHQLYYFLILVLGIRYGTKSYYGLVFVVGTIYSVVSIIGSAYYNTALNEVQLSTQVIYFFAFGILTSFILEREYRQRQEKEELISELQTAYRKLCIYNARVEELAIRDSLTGLYNYRYFSERLEMEFKWAKKYNKPLSLILIDIDHFKRFNDTYGHPAGDIALQTAAEIFQTQIRDRDVLARYGGEEFLILLPDTNNDEAYVCAERIRKAIEEAEIKAEQVEKPLKITVSAGVVSLSGHTASASELLEHVDKALYEAKGTGRNRVIIFESPGP